MPPDERDDAWSRPPLRLGVLISGGGTTLENLIQRIADGRLRGVAIHQVVSSRPGVRGLEIAVAARLPTAVVRRGDFLDDEGFSAAIAAHLDAAQVDLVVLAGFLRLWIFPPNYDGRVLNIHPALLPRFGGRGFYGAHVHSAVLAAGETVSGCTVHLVDHLYDHGPIVAQRQVAVEKGDTVERLAVRVGQAERELLPEILQRVADEGLECLRDGF